jgi:gamma-glutamyltranspeptidase/glutathione hydrolase
MSRGAVVATEHPLATAAAVEVLSRGGNAFDAAVAASLTLTVVLPHLGGLGGDFFALVRTRDGSVHFIDGSGPAPAQASIEKLRKMGYTSMPVRGPLAVTVPGLVDALRVMWQRFGSLEWRELVSKAVSLARGGFPASRSLVRGVKAARDLLSTDPGSAAYLAADRIGALVRFPGLAQALERIAEDPRDFYEGDIARSIASYVQQRGGLLSYEDLSSYSASVRSPITVTYKSCRVHEAPPPTQGITTLHLLKLTEQVELPRDPIAEERVAILFTVSLAAYEARDRYVTDPGFMEVSVDELLDEAFIYKLYERAVSAASALPAKLRWRSSGDTTFFAIADVEGNVMAGIQSLYNHFGAAVTEPKYQVPLNNRGSDFVLDSGHANALEPGKRTLHTLSAMVVECEKNIYALGTSGGHYRPQIHWWLATNILDYGMQLSEAIEAPRVLLDFRGRRIITEEVPVDAVARVYRYEVVRQPYPSRTGVAAGVQLKLEDGVKVAASDVRGDGVAFGTLG